MNFTVYAFNDGYSLASYLNGLIHFFGGDDWGGLVFLVVSLGMAGGLFMAVSASSPVNFIRSMFWPAVMYAAVFGPPCQLNIQDEFSNEVYTVSQVPFGIGLALSTTTAMEKAVIDLCEDYIEPVNAVKFKEFDFFGQVRAISEILVSDLGKNEPLKQTVSQYFDDCVLHGFADASINQWNFLTSSDLMVAMETPYNVFFTTVYNSDGTTTVKTCADAYYNVISPRVMGMGLSNSNDSSLAKVASVFGRRASDLAGIRSSLNNLASVYFSGHQDTADILFRQNFMMTALRSNLAQNNPQALGALTEAELKQKTGMASAAAVYIKQLPNLRAMFKLVILGLLPLTGAFFFIGWGKPLLHWFAALLWVSLFLPIEAIIHAAYMTHSVNELRGLIDVYGGFTWNNQIEILTWVSDTATIAGTLMFMIPSLTGMVLTWVAPKAGMAISSMLAGSRAHDRLVMSGGQGALEGAEQRGLARDQDQMNQMMMEAGDRYAGIQNFMNRRIGEHTNVAVGRSFGQNPLTHESSGNLLNQALGTTMLNSGDSASHARAASDTVSLREAQGVAATAGAMKIAVQGRDLGQVTSQVAEVLKSSDQSVQDAFSKDQQRVLEEMQSQNLDKNLTATQRNEVATALTAAAWASGKVSGGLSTGFLGNLGIKGEIGGEGGARIDGNARATSGTGTTDAVAVRNAFSQGLKGSVATSISHRVAQATTEATKNADSRAFVERVNKSTNFQDALGLVKSSTAEIARARQESESYQSLQQVGTNYQIDVGQQIFGQMDANSLYSLSNERGFSQLHSVVNQGGGIDRMREAAYYDWRDTNTQNRAEGLETIAKLDKSHVGHLAGVGAAILQVRGEYAYSSEGGKLGDGAMITNQAQGVIAAQGEAVQKSEGMPEPKALRATHLVQPVHSDLKNRYNDTNDKLKQQYAEQDHPEWRAQVSEHSPLRAGEGAVKSAGRGFGNVVNEMKDGIRALKENMPEALD